MNVILALGALSVLTIADPAQALRVNMNALLYGDGPHDKLSVPLPAGTYQATLVRGLYTAWRYTNTTPDSWVTGYALRVSDGNEYRGGTWPFATTAQAAFDAIPPTHLSIIFTQPTDGVIQLFVPDNKISDNSGGLSLDIVPFIVPTESVTWSRIKNLQH